MRLVLFLIVFVVFSCKEQEFVPKPRMYPRIEFPQRSVVEFNQDYCNLTFKFPDFARVEKDSFFFDEETLHPCWFDLYVEALNARIYCSYSPINRENTLQELIDDSFDLAGKHNIKASYRKESLIENPVHNVYGTLFNIEGPVATPMQFYLTDSTNNFFRASLYFNDKVDPDSTQILVDFLAEDIETMIETFQWTSGVVEN